MADEARPANGADAGPSAHTDRPSIAERAARRDQLHAGGRDRYAALLRSLQAGHELQIRRRGRAISIDWHPVLWTLVKVAVVVVAVYATVRFGTQWWRENHTDTWSGPDASVRSGVVLADCPIVEAIRVDDFPSWVTYGGALYRYDAWRRPYLGPDTEGFTQTPYENGSLRLVLIDNTPDGQARDTILLWLTDALAGVEYARTPECAPPG